MFILGKDDIYCTTISISRMYDRKPISLFYSTCIMSSFVMGIELLLLFVYIRSQISISIKRIMYSHVSSELTRENRFKDDTIPIAQRWGVEHILNSVCFNTFEHSSTLSTLGYLLVAGVFIALLTRSSSSRIDGGVNTQTTITALCISLSVFLMSQWIFVKRVVLPYYVEVYNKYFPTQNIPYYERDSFTTTAKLLMLLFMVLLCFIGFSIVWNSSISWGYVVMAMVISLFSIVTELITWLLMRGYAIPTKPIIAAIGDCITAVLWSVGNNDTEKGLEVLKASLFPDGDTSMNANTIIKHTYYDNFHPTKVDIDGSGDLVLTYAPSDMIRSGAMITSASLMMIAAVVMMAIKTTAVDFYATSAELAIILVSYVVYTFVTNETTTMQRLITMNKNRVG